MYLNFEQVSSVKIKVHTRLKIRGGALREQYTTADWFLITHFFIYFLRALIRVWNQLLIFSNTRKFSTLYFFEIRQYLNNIYV